MPLFENHVGVSLSFEKIRLVELVYSDKEFLLENVDEEDLGQEIDVRDFGSTSLDVLHSAFKEIISRRAIKSKFISFCLDPEFFEVIEVPYESTLLKDDLIDHFKWEFGKLKPKLNPDDHLIQHIELSKGVVNRDDHSAVLFLNKKIVEGLKSLSSKLNYELRYIDYSHTSANNFLKFIRNSNHSDGLSIFKSDRFISTIVLQEQKPALINKSPYNDAELQVNLKTILGQLIQNGVELDKLSFSVLCGTKIDTDLLEDLRDSFGLELQLINPFEVIKVATDFSSDINLLNNPSRFAPSVGVALRLL